MILLVVAFRYRAGDDERRPGIVDQHAVHLIHHGVMMLPLYHLIGRVDHIVTQIVETEFVVRAIDDVRGISLPAGFAVRLVLVDTIDCDTQPLEDRPIPFGVAPGEVVVYGDDVHALAGKGIEIGGKRRHQRLAFPRSHLGYLSLMQYRTSDELHVIMHHVPGDRTARRHPGVVVDRLLTVNADMLFLDAQVAVQFGGSGHHLGVLLETTR